MSFSCLRSSDPNIHNVDKLYNSNYEEGHLYLGNGTIPLCSATAPPQPSDCVVCFHQFVHAVCSDLVKNAALVMEGGGRSIALKESDCPGFLGDATNENANWSGNHRGHWWWLFLLPVFLVVIMAVLRAFCKRRKRRRTPTNLEGVMGAVDSSEVEPVDEVYLSKFP